MALSRLGAAAAALAFAALATTAPTAGATPTISPAATISAAPAENPATPPPEPVPDPGLALPIAAQRGRIIVRAKPNLAPLARRVAARAPGMLEDISADLAGLPTPRHIDIRLVDSTRDLPRAAPRAGEVPPWASGVAFPRQGVVVIATRHGADDIDVMKVVSHELSHLALGAALAGRAPRWLDEGFAYLHSSDWSMARLRTLTGMAWSGHVLPLADISAGFPARSDQAARAYAESYDFVAFLAQRGGTAGHGNNGNRWPFRLFLFDIAHGKSLNDAAIDGFAAPLSRLYQEWVQSLRDRYLLTPIGLSSLAVWVLGAVLLVFGYLRRKRQTREVLAQWEQEERGAPEPVPPWPPEPDPPPDPPAAG